VRITPRVDERPCRPRVCRLKPERLDGSRNTLGVGLFSISSRTQLPSSFSPFK
jgi:hypothetical protein